MNPQESMRPRPPEEERWAGASYRLSAAVNDVLLKLEREGVLPEGRSSKDPILEKVGGLMDYAERVLADEAFWDTMPEDVSTIVEGYTVKKEELKRSLAELIEEAKQA